MAPGTFDEDVYNDEFSESGSDSDATSCDSTEDDPGHQWKDEAFEMDRIMERIAVFPIDIGVYGHIHGLDEDTVLYIKYV